jgi:site-specific recombinase XerC
MDCTALTVVEQPALPAELTATLELAADFAKASKAKATQDAYGSDFRIFEAWCCLRGLRALPATAESLCAFLADQATLGKRASTLGRRLAAIRYFHRAAGYDTPTGDEKVKAVLSGIRRTIGAAPVRKRAATADIVIAMSPTATTLRTLRNRAIILLGFVGAFRRSELVALNVEDLEESPEGMLVTLRRSKTDQEGVGRRVAIPRGEIACPVAAVRAWLNAAGITEGARSSGGSSISAPSASPTGAWRLERARIARWKGERPPVCTRQPLLSFRELVSSRSRPNPIIFG